MSENRSVVIYFPGLNGLRAIAALGVLFVHITQAMSHFGLNPYVFGETNSNFIAIYRIALYSVSIFFGISGFLITYLLLKEKEKGSINIKYFYLRRVLRIWPLYYLYLSLALITNWILGNPIDKGQLFFYLFLMANIPYVLGMSIPFLTHYWSLGVEEQFYLFWPNWVKRIKHLLSSTLILILIFMSLKLFFYLFAKHPIYYKLYYILDANRFQCMLIGAVFAILYYKNNEWFVNIFSSIYAQSIAWILFFMVFTNLFRISYFLGHELVTIATCTIILAQIQQKNRIFNLENRVFNFFGKISYGIYVWHPLIILTLSKALIFKTKDSNLNYIIVYLLSFCATILIAYLSYEYYEKQFLKLKSKFTTIKSRNS